MGLITSDGCLSSDGRHVDITSKDCNFLTELTRKMKIRNRVCMKNRGTEKEAYRIQIANRNFYDFLMSIGLMQNKSLRLGILNIPSKFFVDFLRGLIDGDGCIRSWIHPSNNGKQWSLRISSGSEVFIKWLKITVEDLLRVKGKLYRETNRHWRLKYGKMAAIQIIKKCYYDDCLGLQRKVRLAKNCLNSPRGWEKSHTVNF